MVNYFEKTRIKIIRPDTARKKERIKINAGKQVASPGNNTSLKRRYCTILFAQYELAKASGFALNTKPMLKM